jgi:Cell division protein CrgA
VPRSKVRRKAAYTPQRTAPKYEGRIPSRAIPILMCAFLLIGLGWIVLWYVNGPNMPVMSHLGPWNLVIGFGLLAVGFGFATRWR